LQHTVLVAYCLIFEVSEHRVLVLRINLTVKDELTRALLSCQVDAFLKRSFIVFTDKVVYRSAHLDGHNVSQHFLSVQERRLDC
jgi:hypothetical protein